MVRINTKYLGDLMCEIDHLPSGNKFKTDAPVDNNGKARFISPTDLVAASISSCVVTIMGIKAKKNNIDINGLQVSAYKEMTNVPHRKIKKLSLDITFPRKLNENEWDILKNVAKTCPVTRSLSSEIEIEYNYDFGESKNQ